MSSDGGIDRLREWIGRSESSVDTVAAGPVARLSATLDRDDPAPRHGDPLPILWHWLYFLPAHGQSDLGADGHARLGGFLPPVPLPRRMFGGGRVEMLHPLRVGDSIVRVSRIADVSRKEGRTGPLVFVRVRHEISAEGRLALREDQDIVYRGNPRADDPPPAGEPAPDDPAWTSEAHPDAVLLFRYSALTFNAFRPHYDRRFATEVQGYPGLVVHAPLIATLLANLVTCNLPRAEVTAFSFRARKALFDTDPFLLCGRPAEDGRSVALWSRDFSGALALDATATLIRREPSS